MCALSGKGRDILKYKIGIFLSFAISVGLIAAAYLFGTTVNKNLYSLGILSIPFLFSAYFAHVRLKDARLRLLLSKSWGFVDHRTRNMDEINLHFRLTRNDGNDRSVLDDRTWNDLDMDSIYAQVDRTLTVPGEQCLYSILRSPVRHMRELEDRRRWIAFFSQDSDLRDKCRLVLAKLGRNEGEFFAEFLWGDPPSTVPKPFPLIFLPISIVLFSILIIANQAWAWLGLLAAFIGSMFTHFRAKRRIGEYSISLRYLGRMIIAAKRLNGLLFPKMKETATRLADEIKSVSKIPRKTAWLALGGNDPFFEYVNVLFLSEIRAYNKAVKLFRIHRQMLQKIFEWIGFLESAMTVVSYRAGIRGFCEPRFTETGPILDFQKAGHPLLENPVCNSLSTNSGGIMITGSNMSGKTTFLKTVGINAVLAQTIMTCPAGKYQARFFRIATLIGRKDNLVEGKSYYLDEIQALRRLLDDKDDSTANLLLLDELFRGTNSAERIAASVEVLLYLGARNGCTIASTHDLEIAEIISPQYANYHFEEKVGSNGLAFNYLLLPGHSTTRNAIQLLRYAGYPREITDAAERRVQALLSED